MNCENCDENRAVWSCYCSGFRLCEECFEVHRIQLPDQDHMADRLNVEDDDLALNQEVLRLTDLKKILQSDMERAMELVNTYFDRLTENSKHSQIISSEEIEMKVKEFLNNFN